MAEERLQRRLAAILSADVVGYSRLMGIDEAGTLARLKALRRDLIDPQIAAHAGRIVKLMGDGVLVEFASAVDAVTCAIEIQKHVRDHDSAGAGADPIQFRVGINVGDIVIDGDDILGDGVNIAARVEGVAAPGGISLSEDAWRQVQGKVAANFVDSGEHSLKNIARPVRVYRVELGGESATQPATPASVLLDKPSIAVLPFTNMSGDAEQIISATAWSRTSSPPCRSCRDCGSSRAIPASFTKDVRSMSARRRSNLASDTFWRAAFAGAATASASRRN